MFEPESAQLRAFIGSAGSISSSELLKAELERALRRRAQGAGRPPRDLLAKLEDLLTNMDLMRIDDDVLSLAGRLAPGSLRTLDALHVASALQVSPLTAFISYDRRQLEAAVRAGLPTASPGVG